MLLRSFRPWRSCLLLFGCAAAAVGWPSAASRAADAADTAPPFTLFAGRILRPDGTFDTGVGVVVHEGKIKQLAKEEETHGQEVRRFDGQAVVCPGLIDVLSSVGLDPRGMASTEVLDPDVSAASVLDPHAQELRAALRAGITTVMVAPEPGSLVSGVPVSFRTHAADGQLDILRDDGPLLFAFGAGAWRQDRPPTSRAGGVYELRKLLEQAGQGAGHPRVRAAVAQQLDSLIVCGTASDVRAARGVLGDVADRMTLVHTTDALDVSAELKGLARPVVVGPYSFASTRRVMMGAAALSRAGLEVVFSGGFPKGSPESLRITAALAVRHGLDPAAARRAMTTGPAQVAGVADRVGSLVPGRDADLVVFSHDPLRLDASVLEVYVKGVRVYAARNSEPQMAGAGS